MVQGLFTAPAKRSRAEHRRPYVGRLSHGQFRPQRRKRRFSRKSTRTPDRRSALGKVTTMQSKRSLGPPDRAAPDRSGVVRSRTHAATARKRAVAATIAERGIRRAAGAGVTALRPPAPESPPEGAPESTPLLQSAHARHHRGRARPPATTQSACRDRTRPQGAPGRAPSQDRSSAREQRSHRQIGTPRHRTLGRRGRPGPVRGRGRAAQYRGEELTRCDSWSIGRTPGPAWPRIGIRRRQSRQGRGTARVSR